MSALEVKQGALVWTGLFSERVVPMYAVTGARFPTFNMTGIKIYVAGAKDVYLSMEAQSWNEFAEAANHYYPACHLPSQRFVAHRWGRMKFFHN